jgi:hypothetical protein
VGGGAGGGGGGGGGRFSKTPRGPPPPPPPPDFDVEAEGKTSSVGTPGMQYTRHPLQAHYSPLKTPGDPLILASRTFDRVGVMNPAREPPTPRRGPSRKDSSGGRYDRQTSRPPHVLPRARGPRPRRSRASRRRVPGPQPAAPPSPPAAARAGRCAPDRVISDCHFAVQLNHFIPYFRTESVAICPKQHSDISLAPGPHGGAAQLLRLSTVTTGVPRWGRAPCALPRAAAPTGCPLHGFTPRSCLGGHLRRTAACSRWYRLLVSKILVYVAQSASPKPCRRGAHAHELAGPRHERPSGIAAARCSETAHICVYPIVALER